MEQNPPAPPPPPVAAPPVPTQAPPKFGLYLSAVRVQDFRALRDIVVELEPDTTVLVGENNSGKTSFLEALAVALGDRRPRLEDLFVGSSGSVSEFQIDLRVEPTAGEDVPDGVRDVVGNGLQLVGGKREFFVIRVTGSVSDDGLDINLRRFFLQGWGSTRATAATVNTMKSPAVSREVLGLLRFDMLDARRDIVEQLRNRRTHWGKTTTNMDIEPGLRGTIETSLKALGDQVTSGSAVLKRVKSDLADLSEALAHGQLNVDIEALPRSLDDLIRAMDIMITSPDSAAFSVGSQGMGTRSLAALLVFRSYVNVIRSKLHAERLLSLSGFEEPEAHLHPQSQRAVFAILNQIGGQRVISTHSAHVASIADFHSYRLFRREGSSSTVRQVDRGAAKSWDATLVTRFVQVQNPEIVFARVVVVVEGQTEAGALPVLARRWWAPRGADGVGVSIVHTEGAGSSKHVLPFLAALGIPWIIFCDGDAAGQQGLKAASAAIGRALTVASPEVIQLPNGQAFEDYIISSGFGPEAAKAATRHHDGPLADYKVRMQNAKLRGGVPRDYVSAGWEDRVLRDFMISHKGDFSPLLADEIGKRPEVGGEPDFPPLLADLFRRIDKLRAGKP